RYSPGVRGGNAGGLILRQAQDEGPSWGWACARRKKAGVGRGDRGRPLCRFEGGSNRRRKLSPLRKPAPVSIGSRPIGRKVRPETFLPTVDFAAAAADIPRLRAGRGGSPVSF